MTQPLTRVVDASVIPDFSMLHFNALEFPGDDGPSSVSREAVPEVGQRVKFGPSYFVVATLAFNPVVTMEWWDGEPPVLTGADEAVQGVTTLRGGGVTVNATTGGHIGAVSLVLPQADVNVRVNVLDPGEDEDFLVQLWPR